MITKRSWSDVVMSWVQLHLHIFRVLANMLERLEKLEAALFHGHPVETVYVPDGMSVETAWQRYRATGKAAENISGKRRFILTDGNGNLLKVIG